jgi:cephalosporin hydroxylase
MSKAVQEFHRRNREMTERMAADPDLQGLSREWLRRSAEYEYSYHFSWLGRPIVQYPQDIVALQELIWSTRPDAIIETGIAHGGSLVFFASMLELLGGEHRRVLGIDIDIREHNRVEIERHPLSKRITMLEGSSTDEDVVARARAFVDGAESVMVVLDSHHTHAHVLRELELYAPLVTPGSYLVVLDTAVEFMPVDVFRNRAWGKGDNPYTAVQEFLGRTDRFEIDTAIDDKLLVTTAPRGYLRCVR